MARTFAEPEVERHERPDGTVVLRSPVPLGPHASSIVHDFRAHSEAHPDRLLVAERDGDGWVTLSWGEARRQVDALAQSLLERGLAGRPVMILGGASRLHLVALLAGLTIGTPVAPVSVAYSLQSRGHGHLRRIASLIEPGLLVAEDAGFAAAVAAVGDVPVLSGARAPDGWLSLAELTAGEGGPDVDRRCEALGRDDVAKILFSSGSTGEPKGIVTTHGMLSANQQQLRQIWPFLTEEPPVLLDWLPWSHTFGGSHNLNLVLTNGGSLWLDDGRPAAGLAERTVRNLADVSPTLYFNVPAGYAALVPLLERDPAAAGALFDRLRFGFFAAAALPQQLWDRLGKLASDRGSAARMTTSWGLTETAPAATSAHFEITRSDCLGIPIPGVDMKLVPVDERYEAWVRGPNVTPGYAGRPDLTEAAFDEEGYFRTGDAVSFADPADPRRGLVFRGRIAEDFKLSTGTFVHVGALRPRLVSASAGLLTDAVICGHDGDRVTALVWLAPAHAGRCDDDGVPEDSLRVELAATLGRLADEGGGSSQRVDRVLVLREPPVLDAGEVTDKGYVNQRAVRERRAAHVALLSAEPIPAQVVALA